MVLKVFLVTYMLIDMIPPQRWLTSRAARGGGGSFKNRKRIGEIGCSESRMTKRKH